MQIKNAGFVKSSSDYRQCPDNHMPEFAFIGRSNVGKSSLINMLTDKKNLAKTSGTPGKTQLINHFVIDNKWYLVDLPGYGFAKTSKVNRGKWEKMIMNYLANRPNLKITFILVDSRLEPQKNDLEIITKFGEEGWPFALVFTKTDKLNQKQRSQNLKNYQKVLLEYWEELPVSIVTSSKSVEGKDQILALIEEVIRSGD